MSNCCVKCGEAGSLYNSYCGLCRFLLKLSGSSMRPTNWAALGLPDKGDYDARQEKEAIPFGKPVQTWYEVT